MNYCFFKVVVIVITVLLLPAKSYSQSLEIINAKKKLIKRYQAGDAINLNYTTPSSTLVYPHASFTYINESSEFIIEELGIEKMKVSYNYTNNKLYSTFYSAQGSSNWVNLEDTNIQKSFYISYENLNAVLINRRGSDFFGAIGGIGLIGFTISPLIAINYNNWKINSNRYFISSGVSIGLIGLALLGSTFVQEPTFYFNDEGRDKLFAPHKEGYWQLNYLND